MQMYTQLKMLYKVTSSEKLITLEPLMSDTHGTGLRSEHRKSRIFRRARANTFKNMTKLLLLVKQTYKYVNSAIE